MIGLVIKDGAVERVELRHKDDGDVTTTHHIHELVGDYFCSAFMVPGHSLSRALVAFADDGAYRKPELKWNVMMDRTLYRADNPFGWPVKGPIVVVAHVGPDAVGMSELEAAAIRIRGDRFRGRVNIFGTVESIDLPVLTFRPGYDVEPIRPGR